MKNLTIIIVQLSNNPIPRINPFVSPRSYLFDFFFGERTNLHGPFLGDDSPGINVPNPYIKKIQGDQLSHHELIAEKIDEPTINIESSKKEKTKRREVILTDEEEEILENEEDFISEENHVKLICSFGTGMKRMKQPSFYSDLTKPEKEKRVRRRMNKEKHSGKFEKGWYNDDWKFDDEHNVRNQNVFHLNTLTEENRYEILNQEVPERIEEENNLISNYNENGKLDSANYQAEEVLDFDGSLVFQENYPEEIPFKELFSVVFLIKINISRNPNLDEIESKRDTSSPIMNNHEAYKGVWNFDDEEVLEKSELRITKNISSKNP